MIDPCGSDSLVSKRTSLASVIKQNILIDGI